MPKLPRYDGVTIESEPRVLPMGLAQIVRYTLPESFDHVLPEADVYQLDMAMTPRPENACGHYSRHWHSDRYEKLGAIWMVPPGEPVRFRSEPGTTTCVSCVLNPQSVAEWLGADSGWDAPQLEATFDLASGRIRALLLHLAEELRMPGFASAAMAELICGQIAIEISRYWRHASSCGRQQGLTPWRLRAIAERLAVAGEPPSLAELAGICGLSVRHLTRGYRISRGHSIGDAIAASRIAQAEQLLRSDRSLKVIAHRLGFASPAGFTYAFRKATGASPGAFRAGLIRGPLTRA